LVSGWVRHCVRLEAARFCGCGDALKTVDVTDLGGSTFLRLPENTIGGETP
jgi:hypothetical protein